MGGIFNKGMAKSSPNSIQQYKQLTAEIKSGKFRPVYFLMGEEPFYIDRLSDLIEQSVLTEAEKSFNQTIVYGRDVTTSQIVGMCKRFPMMSKHQLILVKEAQSLKDTESLIPYFENPMESTVVVFCWKSDKVDKRTKFYKVISSQLVFESNPIPDYEIVRWIGDYIAERGLKATPKAVQLLADHLGSDLAKITNEIDKILINKPNGEINEDDIEKYVGISKDFNLWELQNALANKNLKKAMQIANHFANDPSEKSIIPVLAGLYAFYARLFSVLHEPDKSIGSLKQKYGLFNLSAQNDIAAAIRSYSIGHVENCMKTLLDFDLMSKGVNSPSITEAQLLRELMVRLLA